MQPRRTARTRATASSENADENAAVTTRLTRAKAASLNTGRATALAAKPANNTTTTGTAPANRKRAALGDVSNVHKIDSANGAGGDKKPLKSTTARKSATSTKAAAANGVAKTTRSTSTRTTAKATTVKDVKKEPAASGVARKRAAPSSIPQVPEEVDNDDDENEVESTNTKETGVEELLGDEENKRAAKRPRFNEKFKQAKELKLASAVEGWDDLDAEDVEDPLMVSEYVNEIFDHLKKLEPDSQPNPDYMDKQADLKWKTRGILVDWLIEVHTRFRLLPETLFLAINIVDRFLSAKVVLLNKLQLVGVAAMFVAAKYEEVFSPHVQYFRQVADNAFSEEDILCAERFILATLDYNLSYPNPMNFLRRISKADQYDFQTRTFAKYFMDISLLDHRFMIYLPSHIAAASMYMSRMMLNRGPWDVNLVHFSDYTEEQIIPVFHLMIDYLVRPVQHEAFYKKYASKRFMKVSLHARAWAKRNAKAYGVFADEPLYASDDSSS